MSNNHHAYHDHGNLSVKKLGFSIILNIIIALAQVIGGFISGSLSLLSDALHNFSDVISLIISYIANRLAKKNIPRNRHSDIKEQKLSQH